MELTPRQKLILAKFVAAKRAQQADRRIEDPAHSKQNAFVTDTGRFLAAITTRRGGKSSGLALRFFRAAQKYQGSLCPYFALTRDSAKNIMWPILQETAERFKLPATFTESSLTVSLGRSQIKLFGADMKNFIQRVRGIKTPFAAIDEAQAFGVHLEELVDDILTPATADYEDGAIALTGTPGPVPQGYFFDATQGRHGFTVHRWSILDNPYMPKAADFIADLKRRKGWDDTHPTFRREWLGEWVADPDALVYRFTRARNVCLSLPDSKEWIYVLGVDLGFDPDPSAFVLCAYNVHNPTLYIVDTYKQTRMIVSDVAERMRYYLRQHPYLKIIVDAGGQGKQIAEEIKQRYQVPLQAAEKVGKAGFIELMNADFQRGKIQVLSDCAESLATEYENLVWDSESMERREDGRYPNHLTDAALYAWRYCYNYLSEPAPKEPSRDSQEYMDRLEEQEAEAMVSAEQSEKEWWE